MNQAKCKKPPNNLTAEDQMVLKDLLIKVQFTSLQQADETARIAPTKRHNAWDGILVPH